MAGAGLKKIEIPDGEWATTAIDAFKQKMVELEREAIDKAIIKAMVIPGEIPLEKSSARMAMEVLTENDWLRMQKEKESQIDRERERRMRDEYFAKLEYFSRINASEISTRSVAATLSRDRVYGNSTVFDEWAEFQKWKANQRKEKELAAKPLQKPTRLIDLE